MSGTVEEFANCPGAIANVVNGSSCIVRFSNGFGVTFEESEDVYVLALIRFRNENIYNFEFVSEPTHFPNIVKTNELDLCNMLAFIAGHFPVTYPVGPLVPTEMVRQESVPEPVVVELLEFDSTLAAYDEQINALKTAYVAAQKHWGDFRLGKGESAWPKVKEAEDKLNAFLEMRSTFNDLVRSL